MIKVSVVGAKGRMGSHVVDAVNAAADTELALALDAGDDLAAITPENTDVVVEFTSTSCTTTSNIRWLPNSAISCLSSSISSRQS